MLDDDIELTIDVVDLDKSCYHWGYHYGFVMNISSRSLAGRAYNITFNAYFYASLGKGKNVFGQYTVSDTNPNLNGMIIAHNNGKQVTYPSLYQCDDLQLEDVGLYSIKIDYWGTVGGSITTGVTPLPIELKSFSVSPVSNESVEIAWVTASERNNDYFAVERSIDAKNYKTIATIKGKGNATTENKYHFIDEKLSNGVYYYRLKQVDFDGRSETFQPKSVVIENATNHLIVFPNPSNDGVFNLRTEAKGTIRIVNSFGQLVFEETTEIIDTYILPITVSSGVYHLSFKNLETEQVEIVKLVVN